VSNPVLGDGRTFASEKRCLDERSARDDQLHPKPLTLFRTD
jgi:hypothetical protein